MKQLPNIDLLKDSLAQTKKAIVIMGSNPNFDIAAAALGFAEALRKKGIDTQVASLADMRVEFSRLVGVDSVRRKIGNRNLVISFDYKEDKVEKVSYQISEDGKRFNLVIAPKTGAQPLQPESVNFEFAGAEAEFIAMFGVNTQAELDELVKNEHGLMDNAMSVAFTLFPAPAFAKCHLDAQGLSSVSELAALACMNLEMELDEDSGSNLLSGIDLTTGAFRSSLTTADTFETVAALLRVGAVRPPIAPPPISPSQMPFVPNFRPGPGSYPQAPRPVSPIPPPVNADTNRFAQMLSGSQGQQPPVPPVTAPTPQYPGEYKG